MMDPVIIVHGGCNYVPEKLNNDCLTGVKLSARAGYSALENGGDVVDAVEAAVKAMEDNPIFNAGTGSVTNTDGQVEMDALIMKGDNLDAGTVACVTNVKNPILLARKIMETTDHVCLAGAEAKHFAKRVGLELVTNDELVSLRDREKHVLEHKAKEIDVELDPGLCITTCDTVGAVVLDRHGNLAVGTSTGGVTNQRPGRVGDVPFIGSGGFCDNEIGGVSTTGKGECLMKVCLARHITGLLRTGMSSQEAVERALRYMKERVGGLGGAVCLSKSGEIGVATTTSNIVWAAIKGGRVTSGADCEHEYSESL